MLAVHSTKKRDLIGAILLALIACWCLGGSAAANPLEIYGAAIFRLDEPSSFQEGCFPPCLCPIMLQRPVAGTLRLVDQGATSAGIYVYAVQDVNWRFVTNDGTDQFVTGSGKYTVGSPDAITVVQHRLELDLKVGNDGLQHYDSGWIPIGDMSRLDIAVSINGMFCWDRAFFLNATRLPPEAVTPYFLAKGSTYQHGCWDPCDCLLEEPRPLLGDFGLLPLPENDTWYEEYAVVGFNAQAASSAVNQVIPIRGSGFYWIGGDFALTHRLALELFVGQSGPIHFDSGWIVGGSAFPSIDIFVSVNGMVCLDTILHVVGEPAIGNATCGGIGGLPCPEGFFCKLPVGACCCDYQGLCAFQPGACPEVWDPVCGCDGMTYGNECEADRVGVTIAHYGPCTSVCGRPDDRPCPSGQFCEFPVGACNPMGQSGVCTPTGQLCPAVWDPVCGCDGTTYGNSCEADQAGVTIQHPGPCITQPCSATRNLSTDDLSYCPGDTFKVQIRLKPLNSTQAIGVEDRPPVGWIVSNISHGGVWDTVNGKVKWGPLFPPFPEELSYDVATTIAANVSSCFTGAISMDGITQAICGDTCVHPFCCPRLAADEPQPDCNLCPVGDCLTCDAGICEDGRVSLCEVIGYACAWLRGCNDDMSGMTRAAYIWRSGECYCWNAAAAQWYPTVCTYNVPGCCTDHTTDGALRELEPFGYGRAFVDVESIETVPRAKQPTVEIPISIEPSAGTSAVALEIKVPRGWEASVVSDGGVWDPVLRKVKWGPYFDDAARSVTVFLRRQSPPTDAKTRDSRRPFPVHQLTGTVSFDGWNHPIAIE